MRWLVSGATRAVEPWLGHPNVGLLVEPRGQHDLARVASYGVPWAADNGCFGGLDERLFLRLADGLAGLPGLLWLAVPDVVADAEATLRRWEEWAPRLAGLPLAFVLQDGQERLPVPWGELAAVFVGGSTRWKLSPSARRLAVEAKASGKLVHVGRVNSLGRARVALGLGADTVDGTRLSRFGRLYLREFVEGLEAAERQGVLVLPEEGNATTEHS